MRIYHTAFAFLLGLLFFGNSALAVSWWSFGADSSEKSTSTQNREDFRGQRGKKLGPQMELPEGWEDMTDSEKKTYMEENRPKEGEKEMKGKMELPEGWEEMTDEEKKTYMEENRPEGMKEGMSLPEGWEEMTDEEKKTYMEENKPEKTEGTQNLGQKMSQQKQERNFTKKALRGGNYKKFTGQLKTKKEFQDVEDAESQEVVQFLQQRGILEGYSDGTFRPENPVNRAESLKILLESLGEDPETDGETDFSDVPENSWYAGYVAKAKEKGIVKGYADGTFQPAKTVNQAELLKLAFESFGIDLSSYEVTSLPEGTDTEAWYAPYLQYALDNDLLDEEDVNPAEGMTRKMFSEVIYRLIQQQEEL